MIRIKQSTKRNARIRLGKMSPQQLKVGEALLKRRFRQIHYWQKPGNGKFIFEYPFNEQSTGRGVIWDIAVFGKNGNAYIECDDPRHSIEEDKVKNRIARNVKTPLLRLKYSEIDAMDLDEIWEKIRAKIDGPR